MHSPSRLDLVRSLCVVLAAVCVILPIAEGATLVVANKAEATVALIDLDTGDVVATLGTGEGPHEVGISPDGMGFSALPVTR